MIKSLYLYLTFFFTSLIISSLVSAQVQVPISPDTSKGKKLEFEADRYNFIKVEGTGDFVSLAGHVKMKQDLTLIYCDSAVLNQATNTVEAFGNIHINDADSVHTYSQYLKYLGKEKMAYLRKKVKLTDGRAVLTTEELEYNTFTHIGTYVKGGKVVNGTTVLTSREGYYYGDTRDIYFKNKVFLNDPEYKVNTDTLLYNTYTQIARFTVPTKIKTGTRTVITSEGFYDMKNKKAVFGKRPVVEDKDYTLTADDLAFDDATHFGEAQGSVVYKSKDTANRFAILANNMKSNNNTGSILATQKPLMIIQQKNDTVYVTADTLYSGKLTELEKFRTVPVITDTLNRRVTKLATDSNSNRFFEAYFNVKVFTDSLQAVGDSLFYSFRDSTFRFFKNPVVWSQENQIVGDTIYLFTENKKPKRFYAFENALAINRVEKNLYNQFKGNTINGIFKNGNIDFVRAKGNAENIYYTADEQGGFIGANRSTSDIIDIIFQEKKPYRVTFLGNLQGTISPIRQVDNSQMRVRGFSWLEARRPKTKYDLLGN
ncbi:OstA-like protein [Segetibacter sp.]|jgi:lipopolysaccharide export system protein LptA|uniref:OstA-like protein n=1 Tax=Segetibacter sp. TaxID=2231182 RepID=UPI002604C421|nr:OstA-like protein [Segetibacter sp.]MCW3079216.1 OstA family protein [Segetibacter sp.]